MAVADVAVVVVAEAVVDEARPRMGRKCGRSLLPRHQQSVGQACLRVLTLLGYWKEVGVVELLAVLVETGEVATSSFTREARVLGMTESDACPRSV